MKVKFLLMYLFAALMASLFAHAAEDVSEYRLRQGDVIHVSVWGEKELDKDARVLPDGSMTFPLAGRVDVANLTTPEVEKQITAKLKTYMPDPQVTVVVVSTAGNRAYVVGKVLKPGPVLLESPLTVMQALSVAGGLDRFADADQIKVLKNGDSGQEVVTVNYKELIRGQNLESNVTLSNGDTVLVP